MPRNPEQTALNLREHDLPPLWDGQGIRWDSQWSAESDMHICPPPPIPPCPDCSHRLPRSYKWGEMLPDMEKLRARKQGNPNPRWTKRLMVFRCPHCGHDTVTDLVAGGEWDLGPEDYGPRGSHLVTGE